MGPIFPKIEYKPDESRKYDATDLYLICLFGWFTGMACGIALSIWLF